MARPRRSNRATARPSRNRRFVARALRSRRSRPARASTGSIALETFRRFILSPVSVDNTGKPVIGWIASALPYLSLAMKLVMLTTRVMTSIVRDGVTYSARQVVPFGNTIAFAFGIDDLIYSSPLGILRGDPDVERVNDPTKMCPYRQGRVERLKIKVTPTTEAGSASGQVVVAVCPMDPDGGELLDLFQSQSAETCFEAIMAMPGARTFSAVRPFIITAPPMMKWMRIGGHTPGSLGLTTTPSILNGSSPCYRLHFHYYDPSSSKANAYGEYKESHATFDLTFHGRVQVRSPNDWDLAGASPQSASSLTFPLRSSFLPLVNLSTALIDNVSVNYSDIIHQNGSYYHVGPESYDMCSPKG